MPIKEKIRNWLKKTKKVSKLDLSNAEVLALFPLLGFLFYLTYNRNLILSRIAVYGIFTIIFFANILTVCFYAQDEKTDLKVGIFTLAFLISSFFLIKQVVSLIVR